MHQPGMPHFRSYTKRSKVGNIASIVGGLCSECYINTVVGANIFSEVSSALPNWLTREIFLPFASAGGREEAKRRGNVPYIRGSFIILPLVPDKDDDEFKEDMLEALANYRIKRQEREKG